MEPVGLLGIIKLTSLILRKNFKHFLCIALVWAIPSAFHVALIDPSSFAVDVIAGMWLSIYEHIVISEEPRSYPNLDLSALFAIIASCCFSIIIYLISYPLLTFGVCRACLNKSVCLKGSLLGVLRSAKSLVLTSMCVGVAVFAFVSLTTGLLGIIAGFAGAMWGIGSETGASVMIYIILGVGMAYVTVLFNLAHTAAILEEKTRGWGAMRRSMELLRGRKLVALGLLCVFFAVLEPCKVPELWHWSGAEIVRVPLEALIQIFGMAANVVLYMSCKSSQKLEPLNALVAASARFGPQASSVQAMDVETTPFVRTLPKVSSPQFNV